MSDLSWGIDRRDLQRPPMIRGIQNHVRVLMSLNRWVMVRIANVMTTTIAAIKEGVYSVQ